MGGAGPDGECPASADCEGGVPGAVCAAGLDNGGLFGVHAFVAGDALPVELLGEVFEFGVDGPDEGEFLFASPALELGFTGDGDADVVVDLVLEQAGAAVLRGKAFEGAVAVLAHTDIQLAGDADVERAAVTAHDVGIAVWHGGMLAEAWGGLSS